MAEWFSKFFGNLAAKSFVAGLIVLGLGAWAFMAMEELHRFDKLETFFTFLGGMALLMIGRSVAQDITGTKA
jgi:hypothetical protein